MHALDRFFAPRSVALVGATEDPGKFGGRAMRQLVDFGYRGPIYPVNPNRGEIFGLRCYASLGDLPQTPDHVGIVLPAARVPEALEACVTLGVPFATVFSAGFAETGTAQGRALQWRTTEIAHRSSLRVMGPNCNGLINFVDRFALTSTASINGPVRPAGDIAIASHSGGAGQVNTMWRAQQAGLGISYQVSCGNDADLSLLDYAAFMLESAATRVVLLLAERIDDGAKLAALARRAAALDKPIVMVKVGRTEAGSRAAASHTGALTGADAVFDAALRQLGIVRVDDCNELYEVAMLLRRGRWPRGHRAAAASISGGNLVMLADLGAARGIEWPAFSEATQQTLREALPGFTAAVNPTDLTAAAIGRSDTVEVVGRAVLADPNIDVFVPVLTLAPAAEVRSIATLSQASEKPVAILWSGGCTDDPALDPCTLVRDGHAVYRDASQCMRAVHAAMVYGEGRRRLARPAAARPDDIDRVAASAIVQSASGILTEYRTKALLRCYGLPVTREHLARTPDEAVRHAAQLSGAVALKAQSADLAHKTEAGAIRLGVRGEAAIRAAYDEVLAAARAWRPGLQLDGVLVQEMVHGAAEFFVGISRDVTFGPVIAAGLGGVFIEVLDDVALRLPPLAQHDAIEMLESLRGKALLQGVRGRPALDVPALADCIVRLSWLALDFADRIIELDVNPICVFPAGKGVRVVDALAVIERQSHDKVAPSK